MNEAQHSHTEPEREQTPAPFFRGAPDQPQRHEAETERQDELNDPDWNAIHEDFSERPYFFNIADTGEAEKKTDGRGKTAAENLRCRLHLAFEKCLGG